jgi:hypothetical protein
VDNVWEQYKPEASLVIVGLQVKMLENAAESRQAGVSGARAPITIPIGQYRCMLARAVVPNLAGNRSVLPRPEHSRNLATTHHPRLGGLQMTNAT